jgi:mannose-1-phosphate guanylyltransferase
VQRFTEKPSSETARRFVESGKYYWNGGIFVWRVGTIMAEFSQLLPELYAQLQTVSESWNSDKRQQVLDSAWTRVPRTTIDYGIMERAERVAVIPIDIDWNDVGNWATLSELVPSDSSGNVTHGEGQPLLLDTRRTYVYSKPGRLVTTLGIEDMVIVDTEDALLVCSKEHAQEVRKIVERLKKDDLDRYL